MREDDASVRARVQGVLALSEHTATSGGIHCVPGFCDALPAWAAANADYRNDSSLVAVPLATGGGAIQRTVSIFCIVSHS